MRASKAGCLSSGTSDKRIDYSPGNGNHARRPQTGHYLDLR
jgi:hypothetical protein